MRNNKLGFFDRLKKLLKQRMLQDLVPKLNNLGFHSVGGKSKYKFHPRWVRDKGQSLDAIEFQWDNLGFPKFVINFRSFEHPDDLLLCRSDENSIRVDDFGFRAYMRPSASGWFQPSWFGAMINSNSAIEKVVRSASERIDEISTFLDGGEPSFLMQDSHMWTYPRLLEGPPPWADGISVYHLPNCRIGQDERLSSW